MSATTTAIEIKGIAVSRGGAEVLSSVSLSLYPGELAAIFGSNGAGKTTLLEALMGFLPIRAGTLLVSGLDVTELTAHERAAQGIAFAPQNRRLFASLSARDNLVVGCRGGMAGRRRLLHMFLENFPQLKPHLETPAAALPADLQQLIAFGRALATEPRVLLLDEPLQGLTPEMVRSVWKCLAHMAGTGTAILMAEQNIASAIAHATYACFIAHGRVTRFGPSKEFGDTSEIAALLLGS
jgi:branched-chain amino acid transport system ATP-binding protein